MAARTPFHILVIGWGSELRGDDAAGLVLVRELEAEAPAGVEIIEVPQLTPELAADLARADRVIFVDALDPSSHPDATEPTLRPLRPAPAGPEATRLIPTCVHSLPPTRLLELAALLYEARPEAWLLGLPVSSFDLGMELSDFARRGIDRALDLVAPALRPPSGFRPPRPLTSARLQPL